MYLQDLKKKEELSKMVNTPLQVEGVSYNFDQYIENEWVSHFRDYSYRMRSNFLKGAKIFDGLVTEIQDGVAKMELDIYSKFDTKYEEYKNNTEKGRKELSVVVFQEYQKIESTLKERANNIDSTLNSKSEEIKTLLDKKTKEINTIIENNGKATDTTVGLISKNEIRTLVVETVPKATLEEIWEAI